MTLVDRLGEGLKLLRTRRGWPQKQLAARAGITKGMVSNYETGKTIPTLITVQKILTALEADLCDVHCTFEFNAGRRPIGHDLSRQFQPGQAKPSRIATRLRAVADGTAADGDAAEQPPRTEDGAAGAPRLPEDFERALSATMGGVKDLVRHFYQLHRKQP